MAVCCINKNNITETVDKTALTCQDLTANVTLTLNIPSCGDDYSSSDCDCPNSIKITKEVTDNFKITSITSASAGTTTPSTFPTDTITWTLNSPEAGNYTLIFAIEYDGTATGTIPINESLELLVNNVTVDCGSFTGPSITVPECGSEECNTVGTDDSIFASTHTDSCEDAAPIDFVATPYQMETLGRIIQVKNIVVKNVCPNKRLSVAVILSETDEYGENPNVIGVKTVLVPAQEGSDCNDVCLGCLNFVAPEALVSDIDESQDTTNQCRTRYFSASVIANYADSDYEVCNGGVL